MIVIMFQNRFAELVRVGAKRQTIRKRRKRRIHPKDDLSLRRWTGLPYRSKQETLRLTQCSSVHPIRMSVFRGELRVRVNDRRLDEVQVVALAQADGFKTTAEMKEWFETNHSFPFDGDLICWN